jgi:hypothetical protein
MGDSSRLQMEWSDDELTIVLDMYFNGHFEDDHDYDDFARCLGRYSPSASTYKDGAVNQKLAEIMGYVERRRQSRHPGERLLSLIEKYSVDQGALRRAAIAAWRVVLRTYSGQVPPYAREICNQDALP